eukprot:15358760-Ditylum_brightwellii.AAC.1
MVYTLICVMYGKIDKEYVPKIERYGDCLKSPALDMKWGCSLTVSEEDALKMFCQDLYGS